MNYIYLDFEGFTNKDRDLLPPVIAGIKRKGQFIQFILNKEFKILKNEDKKLNYINFESFLDILVKFSIEKELAICAYSEHELNLIDKYTKYSTEQINFINVKKEIKRFVNKNIKLKKLHENMKEFKNKDKFNKTRWKLSTILTLFRFKSFDIKAYGGGKTTDKLRSIMSGIKRSGDYKGLTSIQKSKWTKVLNHNRTDVDGIQYLMDIITK